MSADKAPRVNPSFLQNIGTIEIVVLRCKEAPTVSPAMQNVSAPQYRHDTPRETRADRSIKTPRRVPPSTKAATPPTNSTGGTMGRMMGMGMFDGPADDFNPFANQPMMFSASGMQYDFNAAKGATPPLSTTRLRPAYPVSLPGMTTRVPEQVPHGPVPQIATILDDSPDYVAQMDGIGNTNYYRTTRTLSPRLGGQDQWPSRPLSGRQTFSEFPREKSLHYSKARYVSPTVEDSCPSKGLPKDFDKPPGLAARQDAKVAFATSNDHDTAFHVPGGFSATSSIPPLPPAPHPPKAVPLEPGSRNRGDFPAPPVPPPPFLPYLPVPQNPPHIQSGQAIQARPFVGQEAFTAQPGFRHVQLSNPYHEPTPPTYASTHHPFSQPQFPQETFPTDT